jgi:hypothetical protein
MRDRSLNEDTGGRRLGMRLRCDQALDVKNYARPEQSCTCNEGLDVDIKEG